MTGNISHFGNLAIAFDQLVNAAFGGSHEETISAAAWRLGEIRGWKRWHYFRIFIDFLFCWQKKVEGKAHCEQAFESELYRVYLAKEYKNLSQAALDKKLAKLIEEIENKESELSA